MLNADRIRTRAYHAIQDSPDGQGTYSHEMMDTIVEDAVKKFLEISKAAVQRTIVRERAWLHGLAAILWFENKNGEKIIPQKWEFHENEIYLFDPKEAVVVWAYAGFQPAESGERTKNSLKGTAGINGRAEQAVVYLCQAEIFRREIRYNDAEYFEKQAREIALHFKKRVNMKYKGGSHGI